MEAGAILWLLMEVHSTRTTPHFEDLIFEAHVSHYESEVRVKYFL